MTEFGSADSDRVPIWASMERPASVLLGYHELADVNRAPCTAPRP